MKSSGLAKLYAAGRTIFSTKDLSLLWRRADTNYLKTKTYRLTKKSILIPLRRGLYAIKKDYNHQELANQLLVPSYISLHTVLSEAGAIFQYNSTIASVSRITRESEVDGVRYSYQKIKDAVLFNKSGIAVKDGITKACPERAWLDWLYLNKNASLDNDRALDWQKCLDLLPLYRNAALEKRLKKWLPNS
ncbi:MAG: hypothetical protein Q8P95_04295 [bacterium]|nr:hypothetical protein [bacterium]